MNNRISHPVPPVYNKESQILILGTFPSVKSREGEFFYHHPQNRFWPVICEVFNEKLPETIEEKRQLLLRNHIALWDVVESCEITGSADSSIKNVIPNNIGIILRRQILRKYLLTEEWQNAYIENIFTIRLKWKLFDFHLLALLMLHFHWTT